MSKKGKVAWNVAIPGASKPARNAVVGLRRPKELRRGEKRRLADVLLALAAVGRVRASSEVYAACTATIYDAREDGLSVDICASRVHLSSVLSPFYHLHHQQLTIIILFFIDMYLSITSSGARAGTERVYDDPGGRYCRWRKRARSCRSSSCRGPTILVAPEMRE